MEPKMDEGLKGNEKIENYTALEKDAEGLYPIEEGKTYYHKIEKKTFNEETCEWEIEEVYEEFVAPSAEKYAEEIAALADSDAKTQTRKNRTGVHPAENLYQTGNSGNDRFHADVIPERCQRRTCSGHTASGRQFRGRSIQSIWYF